MRKTTIFRSSSIALSLVLSLLVVSGARAQDSLQVSPQSGVHIVTQGETLWDIAAQYFGDPFLWPERRIGEQSRERPRTESICRTKPKCYR